MGGFLGWTAGPPRLHCIDALHRCSSTLQLFADCRCRVCCPTTPPPQVVFDFIEKRYPEIVSFNVEGAKVLPPAVVQEVRPAGGR